MTVVGVGGAEETLGSTWTISEGDYRSGVLRENPADDETDVVSLTATLPG